QDGVFTDERERAVFKFDLGAAIFGGYDEALPDGQVEIGILPRDVLVAGERVAFDVTGKTHVSLNIADANNSDMTDVGGSGRGAGKNSEEEQCESADGNRSESNRTGQHDVTPCRGLCYLSDGLDTPDVAPANALPGLLHTL